MAWYGAAPRSDRGAKTARLFRQVRVSAPAAPGSRRLDLAPVLAEDGLEVCELPGAAGHYTAALLRHGDGPGGVVFLAPGQPEARQRFSISHELGHYHIPRHRRLSSEFACTADDLTEGLVRRPWAEAQRAAARDAVRREVEWEANDFATELLMPARQFAEDARAQDVSVETALAAADAYGVSVTAAAWRLVQVSDEACAVVVSRGGRAAWVARGDGCPRLACERGTPVAGESAAAAVARGERHRVRPERVIPRAWLADPDACRGPVLESTLGVPSAGYVLSVLWMPEAR